MSLMCICVFFYIDLAGLCAPGVIEMVICRRKVMRVSKRWRRKEVAEGPKTGAGESRGPLRCLPSYTKSTSCNGFH